MTYYQSVAAFNLLGAVVNCYLVVRTGAAAPLLFATCHFVAIVVCRFLDK